MTISWDSFTNDMKLAYMVDSIKEFIASRKDDESKKPFTSQEYNAILKSVYFKEEYAGPDAFWNGGTYKMLNKNLKNFVQIAIQPKFKNKIIKELSEKMVSYGILPEVKMVTFDKKRKRDEDEEDITDYWMNRAKVAEKKLIMLEPVIQSYCNAYNTLRYAFNVLNDTHNFMHNEIDKMTSCWV